MVILIRVISQSKKEGARDRKKEREQEANVNAWINARILSANRTFCCFALQKADGMIQFSKVEFQYPTRPEVQVLKGLNLIVKPGQMVALVGQSGCGKSTCIQLLQRLYDPLSGNVTLDRRDISSVSLATLRSQLGVVGQEPVLFDRTIAENIAYGDNYRQVPMDEIIEAAKRSNIHSFVSSLPLVSRRRFALPRVCA